MKTKLTLTVEEDVIRKAKQVARRQKTSVSALFEQWSAQMEADKLAPLGERLRGRWTQSGVKAEMDPRLDAILEKHA